MVVGQRHTPTPSTLVLSPLQLIQLKPLPAFLSHRLFPPAPAEMLLLPLLFITNSLYCQWLQTNPPLHHLQQSLHCSFRKALPYIFIKALHSSSVKSSTASSVKIPHTRVYIAEVHAPMDSQPQTPPKVFKLQQTYKETSHSFFSVPPEMFLRTC